MATVINNPDHNIHDSPMGTLIGMVLLIIMMLLFFVYAIPYISNIVRQSQLSLPNRIDVNKQQPK